MVVGYLLILVGLAIIVLYILVSLGVISPTPGLGVTGASPWDVLIALIEKLPPMVILGLLLIYAGLKLVGANLPF